MTLKMKVRLDQVLWILSSGWLNGKLSKLPQADVSFYRLLLPKNEITQPGMNVINLFQRNLLGFPSGFDGGYAGSDVICNYI